MPPLDGVKVLVVEDHQDTLEMLCVSLGHHGAQTDCTSTIGDALSAARGARPDVLVADLQMADNGIQLVAEIRRLVGHVPALIISAHARAQDRDRAIHAGPSARPRPRRG